MSADLVRQAAAALEALRADNPLVHCIANHVTAPDTANMLLAAGASPIMADDPAECAEVTAHAQALSLNPRPGYQHDPTRRYGFSFDGLDVRFTIDGDTLTVVEVVTL